MDISQLLRAANLGTVLMRQGIPYDSEKALAICGALTAIMTGEAMLMTLTVADSRELVGWVLSFGSGVRVLGPQGLIGAVSSEAKKILHS